MSRPVHCLETCAVADVLGPEFSFAEELPALSSNANLALVAVVS